MSIDESQLHPVFRPLSVDQKREQQRLRTWKALFYTVKSLTWKEACRNLRAQGLADGSLVYNEEGEVVTASGDPLTVVFNEYRSDFDESFDRGFAKATAKELIDYAYKKFGLTYEQLMEINSERLAQFRGRASTKPIPPSIDNIHF
jgi:hypothetical protein